MREFFSDGLHVFIILMIFVLGLGAAAFLGGGFDEWGKRLRVRRKKKRMDYH